MRVHIKTTPSKEIIGFNHLHLLTGTIHKWFGDNEFHNSVSLYSFSNLTGGKADKSGLNFANGATFYVSCWEPERAKQLVKGILEDPEMFFGLSVVEIILQETPDLSEKTHFQVGSPIFIQRTIENGNKKFYYFDDKEASQLMVETLNTKMQTADILADDTLKISFDQNYPGKGTKKLNYKHGNQVIQIRANWCPVIIEGKPETKQFAWNVGLGNSTGIGFGAIK